jgi:hypothetical protein
MDYGRFNYVAQPGDGARLIPMIGPYDLFAVEWGYKPVVGAKNPDDERKQLNRIAARQETEPYLRFGVGDPNDPTIQTEDMGSDPVAATRYGLKNINAIAEMLISATTKEGEDYSTLREVYGELLSQRNRELVHVATYVGGIVRTDRVAGQSGEVFAPIARKKQKECVEFLQKEAFRSPTELLKSDILRLIESHGAVERVLAGQRQVLNTLLNNDRMNRLISIAAAAKKDEQPYALAEMLSDVKQGIWSELKMSPVKTDIYRRNLQRTYIDALGNKLNPPPFTPPTGLPPGYYVATPPPLPGEARALIRAELVELDGWLARAMNVTSEKETKAHLMDSRDRISKILYPDKGK